MINESLVTYVHNVIYHLKIKHNLFRLSCFGICFLAFKLTIHTLSDEGKKVRKTDGSGCLCFRYLTKCFFILKFLNKVYFG